LITYVSGVLTGKKMKKQMKKPQPATHCPQQITMKTRKLLDQMCKKTKLSRPMQLEQIVEQASV
tara:strand:+ start:986 stop:1177 length:192 start_codon:yes stop_codon:yes gene_type:complete